VFAFHVILSFINLSLQSVFFGFDFYFAFLHPAFSMGKIKSESMVTLVQILHEFVTSASV